MKVRFAVTAVLAAALATGALGSAKALLLNGTFGFAPLGTTVFSGATLGSATDFTVPAAEIVNNVPPTYNFAPNDFATVPAVTLALGLPVGVSPLTLGVSPQTGTPIVDYLEFGPLANTTRFHFTLNSYTTSSSGPLNLSVLGQGTVHDTLGVYGDNAATISYSLTQDSPTSAVNLSGTFSTPPSSVPEPGTYAFMATSGVGGLLMLRRRKKA